MKNNTPFARRSRFVILDRCVNGNDEFVLKIYYDKEQYEHLIDQYVNEMIREIKSNMIPNDAGWDNQFVLVDRIENSPDYFESTVFLVLKTY